MIFVTRRLYSECIFYAHYFNNIKKFCLNTQQKEITQKLKLFERALEFLVFSIHTHFNILDISK